MTRDEAIDKVYRDSLHATDIDRADFLTSRSNVAGFVDALAALGLLKLETKDDTVRVAAVLRLSGIFVPTDTCNGSYVLGNAAASEIIDVLTKSGFKITRDKCP